MMHALPLLVIFFAVLLMMARHIAGPSPKKASAGPKVTAGMWVQDALLWSPFRMGDPARNILGKPVFDDRVTGMVTKVHRDGTITVRDWESGDELRCLGIGFTVPPPHEAAIMSRLRTEQDIRDMGEGPSKEVH